MRTRHRVHTLVGQRSAVFRSGQFKLVRVTGYRLLANSTTAPKTPYTCHASPGIAHRFHYVQNEVSHENVHV